MKGLNMMKKNSYKGCKTHNEINEIIKSKHNKTYATL